MRVVALVLFSIAVPGGGGALAQGEPAARERAYDIATGSIATTTSTR